MNDAVQLDRKSEIGPPNAANKAKRWSLELGAAKKAQDDFWREGDGVIKEYLGGDSQAEGAQLRRKRLNLYYADIQTRASILSGIPNVRARRRFADAADDVARVAADAVERLLNSDIDRDTDGYRKALALAKMDWMNPGLGTVKLRYVNQTETVPETPAQMAPCQCGGYESFTMCPQCQGTGQYEAAPAVPAHEQTVFEDVETDHVQWKDVLWSPCRTWNEMRWRAYRWEQTPEECEKRWGKQVAKDLPRTSKVKEDGDEKPQDAWARIEGWEIWDKIDRKRIQFVEGYPRILEEEDDPLGLPGFFPEPEPLMANLTTSKYVPKANYCLARDLYEESHELTTRIRDLVRAAKIRGVYDKASTELKRLLDEACEDEMLPVENYAALVDKGGISSALMFLPIKDIVEATVNLVEQRNVVKRDLYEITGQSDIMRGQASEKATATEQRIKARFGGTRIQAQTDELARFASEAQRIRFQIIAKFFSPETIKQRSNIGNTVDADLLDQAIQLIKSDTASFRIEIDADSVAMTDFDAVQQEGIAIMQATAEFFKGFAPFLTNPMVGKFILELYQQMIAGFRGAQRFEGIIDRGIEDLKRAAAQPPPPPPPDPKAETEKIKAGVVQQKAQADVTKIGMDMQVKQAEHGMEMQRLQAEVAADTVKTHNEVVRSQAAPPGVNLKED